MGRYSQLCHILGHAFGEGTEPLVAASHHGVHTGALLWTAWAQRAAALLLACGEPREGEWGRGEPLSKGEKLSKAG